jgi:uncharacterized protein
MHHDPARNVLHRKYTMEELAKETGKTNSELQALIQSARAKLLRTRLLRPTPFIDRTFYTGWNAMAVTAYLETARVLRPDGVRDFALLTLDRLLREAWDGGELLFHVIAYPAGASPVERVQGTLDDYAFAVHACIDGWSATGEMRYFNAAVKLADAMIARFYDQTAGAFYDTATPADGAVPLAVLSARRKPLQDSPTPAGNPTAAAALLRLESLSGRVRYREVAEDTLGSFAGIVDQFGLYAASYGLALERMLLDPVQIVIVGASPEADRLEATAVSGFAVNKTVVRLETNQLVAGNLPEVLAETLLQAPVPNSAAAWAMVCRRRTCLPPITDPDELLKATVDSN